jgi:hypothetical protein
LRSIEKKIQKFHLVEEKERVEEKGKKSEKPKSEDDEDGNHGYGPSSLRSVFVFVCYFGFAVGVLMGMLRLTVWRNK